MWCEISIHKFSDFISSSPLDSCLSTALWFWASSSGSWSLFDLSSGFLRVFFTFSPLFLLSSIWHSSLDDNDEIDPGDEDDEDDEDDDNDEDDDGEDDLAAFFVLD